MADKFYGFTKFTPTWWYGEIDGATYDLYTYRNIGPGGGTNVQVVRDGQEERLFRRCGPTRAVKILLGMQE